MIDLLPFFFRDEKEIPSMSHTFLSFKYSLPHLLINATYRFFFHTLDSRDFLPVYFLRHSPMIPELEKPKVTEIQVRMDCNGCVQKIKKALHGINGIYDLYIDFPQQKLTIIGWADPEKIVKAIRKTRKIATICSHTEPPEPAPEGGAPPPAAEEANPTPAETPQAEAAPPAEPPKDPPQPENPPPEEKPTPSSVAAETNANQPPQNPHPKDVGEVHLIYHHPPDYGYRYGYGHSHVGQWNRYPNGQGLPPEPSQPIYVTHSYNTYRPSPYVTEYEHIRSPPRYTAHNRMSHYSDNYHENSSNGSITSIFSDENPNACSIV
ncbi:heavy metal-associated isoprenylated plant protein 35-like [Mercurialis annua]|uniref:heavy metal-associated isoprenylated plant protein 35-like n=1 Tax=Mercurialis annua TaxID=3986 RepID=UPI00215DF0AF|nr:heavy metal-associated isoprenylated plant protein 35-like [Mercurialis annua]